MIDLRTGQKRIYDGDPPRSAALGFDNRCDVSAGGYMPNVDVWYAVTDPSETFFVRRDGKKAFREDVVHGATIALEGSVDTRTTYLELTQPKDGSVSILPFTETVPKRISDPVKAIDSDGAAPRTSFVALTADNIVIDEKFTIPFPSTDSSVDYLDFATGLVVVSRRASEEDNRIRKRCAFTLDALNRTINASSRS